MGGRGSADLQPYQRKINSMFIDNLRAYSEKFRICSVSFAKSIFVFHFVNAVAVIITVSVAVSLIVAVIYLFAIVIVGEIFVIQHKTD